MDKTLLNYVEKDLWANLEEAIPNFESTSLLCFVAHVAVAKKEYKFLKSAVSVKGLKI